MDMNLMTKHIAGVGKTSLKDIAKTFDADLEDVRVMAKVLETHWLVKLEGDNLTPTTSFTKEYGFPQKKNFSTDLTVFHHYLSHFWSGGRESLYRRFRMSKKELTEMFEQLHLEGSISYGIKKKFGLFKREHVEVIKKTDKKKFDTKIDEIVGYINKFGTLSTEEISYAMNIPCDKIDWIGKILSTKKFYKITYGKGQTIYKKISEEQENIQNVYPTPSYTIEKDGLNFGVHLTENKYTLTLSDYSREVMAVLEKIYDLGEDHSADDEYTPLKSRLKKCIEAEVDFRLSFEDELTRKKIKSTLATELYLGKLEYLLADSNIEEIKAKGGSPVYVKHLGSKNEWLPTNITITCEKLRKYAKAIARETNQQIDASHPLMDAILHTKDRVNVSLPQVTGDTTLMEIRVFSKKPWSIVRLIKNNTVSVEVLAFLWLAIQNKFNILVSGETGCGKTSFINALTVFLPQNDHIVTIEDTREIQLPKTFGNWSPLTTKQSEHIHVPMDRLLINALRMNPSHLILGEVRSKKDIETLVAATSMGHPIMSTIHTRDCATTVKRFEDAGIGAQELSTIHLNVILESIRSKECLNRSYRRVKEIGEYIECGAKTEVNRIFRLQIGTDTLNLVNEPRNYFQKIMDCVDMTKKEILTDLVKKENIIKKLVEENIDDNHLITQYIHAINQKCEVPKNELQAS